jgi:phosphoglycerate kinase
MHKLKVQDLDIHGKRVLVRVDFNVPLDVNGNINDDTRILAALPTIQYLLDKGGRVILISHLGRPKKGRDAKLSLAPCALALSSLLGKPVKLAPDCIGPAVESLVNTLENGQVLLLENVRFHPAEENPSLDPDFARKLANLGEVYVNDAFGAAHREHTSTTAIAAYFPGHAAAGLLLQKEIKALESLLLHPVQPFYSLIGGAKITSKIGLLHALADRCAALFIGGAMAFPFFVADGISIGDSLFDPDTVQLAKEFADHCKKTNTPLFLPLDLIIADAFSNDAHRKVISVQEGIPKGWQGLDIGPKTIYTWKMELQKGSTIFWNGPLGVCEFSHFCQGTNAIAQVLAHLDAVTVVGGGDSISAINHLQLASHFTHISTGGGASLEFIEKGALPGIDALSKVII